MASTASQAGQAWHHALKLRKLLLKQLEQLQAGGASGVDLSQFEAVDGLLEKFRLACVQTIFLDFKYAVKENTEYALWGLHISINAEYRRTLGRLKHSSHPVERRKAEKMYNNFLRIAQKFYKGYIQRLSARYDIPELRRVAQGMDLEHMEAEDIISPVPGSLGCLVVDSCHSTLLHLGDLARYRIQARRKNSGFETALTCYGLARHLMPKSGFAFHQMGIVNLDQGNHLDVVYHFYRAWAVETPHPNARANLESEFRSLRLPHVAKARSNPSAPADVFGNWFVKLHAFFYNDEAFSQQKELEEEVMHRLEMACRDASSRDTLLKMALINISAYDVASQARAGTSAARNQASSRAEKKTEAKAESACRFWQFTLRFNALFITTFCRALQSQLEDIVSNETESSADPKAVKISSNVESLLPTLRVYCVWLAAHRQDIIRSSDAFGAAVPTMMHYMAKVFTLLCAVSYSQDNLAPCPYLLAEDIEVRGHRPLMGDGVPRACMVSCDEQGNTKPYLYNPQQRLDTTRESLARVLDVLRCAYFLAEDRSTPMTCQVMESALVFQYQPDSVSSTSQDPVKAMATSLDQPRADESDGHSEHGLIPEARGLEELHASEPHAADMSERDTGSLSETGRPVPTADEDETERTVIAMLTPFLKPPELEPQQRSAFPHDQPLYPDPDHHSGMRKFSLLSYSSPTGSGPMAPFPWAWDNTPKPDVFQDAAYTAGKEAFNRVSGNNSPQEPTSARNSFDDPFATPGRDAARVYASTYREPPRFGNSGSAQGFVADMPHRDHFQQPSVGNGTPRTSSFGQGGMAGGLSFQSLGGIGTPLTLREHGLFAASSGTSDFSHPSSLYMGTPADCVGLGVSGVAGQGRNRPESSPHGITAPSTRHVQASNSALR